MNFFALYPRWCGRLCIVILFLFIVLYAHAQNAEHQNTNSESTGSESVGEVLSSSVADSKPEVSEEDFPILQENAQDSVEMQPIGLWDTVRVFIVLAFVIIGIYILVWALKKFQSRSFTHSQTIRVLASRQLSGGGNVHLIKLGKSLFFIGASNQNITLMKEIDEKEEVDEIGLSLSVVEEEETKGNAFYEKIQHIFKKGQAHAADSKRKNVYKNNVIQETFDVIKSMFGKQAKRGKELDA